MRSVGVQERHTADPLTVFEIAAQQFAIDSANKAIIVLHPSS